MARYIYVPANDENIGVAQSMLVSELYHDDKPKVVGSDVTTLAGAEKEVTRLYVLGHGNWGAGIGTHKTHYGAHSLTKRLIDLKLVPNQRDLEIHLYACNTGVAGSRVIGTRRPYAARLAEALAAQQFTGTRVIGYVGFLGILSLTLFRQYKGGKNSGRSFSPVNADNQVVFQVSGGQCSQLSGGSWKMDSTFAWRKVDIVKGTPKAKKKH